MSSLRNRFSGKDNRGRRIARFGRTRPSITIRLLKELANVARVGVFSAGNTLIRQNDTSDDLFFILAGRVSIDNRWHE
jgi:CRP-like cAMP-binding protein